MIKVWWWLVLLVFGRMIGLPVMAVWFGAALMIQGSIEGKLPTLVAMGVLADMVMGTRFGLTSLLLVVIGLELTIYREKFGFSTPWPVGLMGLLVTAQAAIVWQQHMGIWVYVLSMPIVIIFSFWLSSAGMRGGQKGIYLKGS